MTRISFAACAGSDAAMQWGRAALVLSLLLLLTLPAWATGSGPPTAQPGEPGTSPPGGQAGDQQTSGNKQALDDERAGEEAPDDLTEKPDSEKKSGQRQQAGRRRLEKTMTRICGRASAYLATSANSERGCWIAA